ncbi:MAG: oligoendopeptidase F, partial [Paracoccaceae bacterium]
MKEKYSKLNDLPSWDLSDLYVSPTSKKISKDLNWLEKSIRSFKIKYEEKLKKLNHQELLNCIFEHEAIEKKIARIMSY